MLQQPTKTVMYFQKQHTLCFKVVYRLILSAANMLKHMRYGKMIANHSLIMSSKLKIVKQPTPANPHAEMVFMMFIIFSSNDLFIFITIFP